MKLSDLKKTYNVLCDLDYPVPQALLTHIAGIIRTTERRNIERRKSRMTEEQLIRWEGRKRRTMRIILPDGRMIQRRNNQATFHSAIKEIGPERIVSLDLKVGRNPVIHTDETLKRKYIRNHIFIKPGYFLIGKTTTVQKVAILNAIDTLLKIGLEIETA